MYYNRYRPKKKNTKDDNAKQIEKISKKNPDISPVIISGNKIAKTWWAIAWNRNLESYADYSNRIARGRSYLRSGAVIDLKIETGFVNALVQGSRKKPYEVYVKISEIDKDKWEKIVQKSSNRIENIESLAEGKFPKDLEELFTMQGSGLFPSPKDIHFECSCPDWAYMCKHVAAVLYGIGARFDDDPTLMFKLRDMDFEVLLKKSIDAKMQSLLRNAGKKSERVIDETDASELFGLG